MAQQCVVGGSTFQDGDAISTSRCGSDYPCFCNQGAVKCPFCSFPTQGGGLVCANDDESVTFTNLNSQVQTCSCQIPVPFDNNPQSTCIDGVPPTETVTGSPTPSPTFVFLPRPTDDPVLEQPRTSRPTSAPSLRPVASPTLRPVGGGGGDDSDSICRFELDDGSFAEFQPGESLGTVRVSQCGTPDEFPCYCDPSVPGNLVCPYCGFLNSANELNCAQDDEVIQFEDNNVLLTCSCEIPDDPTAEPIKSCVSDVPAFTDAPTESPGQGSGNGDGGCVVPTTASDPSSGLTILQSGESFGTLVQEGPCGSVEDWPFVCAPNGGASGGDKEYPYCQFLTIDGDTRCARDGETVYFHDIQNQPKRCSCTYFSAILGPLSSCEEWEDNGAGDHSPTPSPSTTQTVDEKGLNGNDDGSPTSQNSDNHNSSDTICISRNTLVYSSVGLGVLLLVMVIGAFIYLRRKGKIQEY